MKIKTSITKWRFCAIALSILFIMIFMSSAGKAQNLAYHVTVDTSAIASQNGYLDFQYNPGSGSLLSTVNFSNFMTDGILVTTSQNTGGASGSLPSASIANSSGYNDLFQGITFGQSISFDITFSDQAQGSGSAFAMGLYDSTDSNPLLTTDPVGAILFIGFNPDGTTTINNFPSDNNGGPPVAQSMPLLSVPEPSSKAFLIAMVVMTGLFFAAWRRARRRTVTRFLKPSFSEHPDRAPDQHRSGAFSCP